MKYSFIHGCSHSNCVRNQWRRAAPIKTARTYCGLRYARDELFRRDAVGRYMYVHGEVVPHLHPSPRGKEAAGRGGWSLASSRSTDREFLDSGGSVRSRRFCSLSPFRISCFLHCRWLCEHPSTAQPRVWRQRARGECITLGRCVNRFFSLFM